MIESLPRIPNHFPRRCHAAVLEPVSRALWVIGGHPRPGVMTTDVVKMSPNLLPLKDLLRDHVARNIRSYDGKMQSDQFPVRLTEEVKNYRSKMGEVHLCGRESGCRECGPRRGP